MRESDEVSRQRITGVLLMETGLWRVLQWHMSVAVSTVELYGVELSTELGVLVDSLDSSSGEAIEAASHNGTVTLLVTEVGDSIRNAASIGDAGWSLLIGKQP